MTHSHSHPLSAVRAAFEATTDTGKQPPRRLKRAFREAYAAGGAFAERYREHPFDAITLIEPRARAWDHLADNTYETALLRAVFCTGIVTPYYNGDRLTSDGFPNRAAVTQASELSQALMFTSEAGAEAIATLPGRLFGLSGWNGNFEGIRAQATVIRAAHRAGLTVFRPTQDDDAVRKIDLLICHPKRHTVLAVQLKYKRGKRWRILPLWQRPSNRLSRHLLDEAVPLWRGVQFFRSIVFEDTLPVLLHVNKLGPRDSIELGETFTRLIEGR